ncbi:MAG: endonuclease domain-containing protein [Flavobacteriales bacterium]
MSHSFYNKNLKGFAQNLRTDSTLTEVILWTNILKESKTGYPFLRQRAIGKFIADFMCRKLKLIIELDGYSHNFKHEEDLQRDIELEKLGYKTLRFHDEEVMENIESVEHTIIFEMKEREKEMNLECKVISNFD